MLEVGNKEIEIQKDDENNNGENANIVNINNENVNNVNNENANDENAYEEYAEVLKGNVYEGMDTYINEDDVVTGISDILKETTTVDYSYITSPESLNKDRVVHAAKLKEKERDGEYVLRFNISGSGLNQWPKMYKGFSGYNEMDQYEASNEDNGERNRPSRSLYDVLKKLAHKKFKVKPNTKAQQAFLKQKIHDTYGKPMYIDEQRNLSSKEAAGYRMISGIRKKVRGKRVDYNLSGPLGRVTPFETNRGNGDSGDFCIDYLRGYVKQLAAEYLSNISPDEDTPINIYIQGYSRGGCAADEASVLINEMLQDERFDNIRHRVKIKLQMFDPVPGVDSISNHREIDHNSADNRLSGGNYGTGLHAGAEDNKNNNDVTVQYSLHSNHSVFFTPQKVKGANRVILTGMSHNMSLFDVVQEGNKKHKRNYVYAENGEEYGGTGMDDLGDGIFVLDENKVLVKLNNQQEAFNFLDRVYSTTHDRFSFFTGNQKDRHQIMYDVVSDWFEHHPDKEIITKKDSRYEAYKALNAEKEKLTDILKGFNPNGNNNKFGAKDVKESVERLLYQAVLKTTCENDPKRFTNEALKKYHEASRSKRVFKQFINNTQIIRYMKSLKLSDVKRIASDKNGEIIKEELQKMSQIKPDKRTSRYFAAAECVENWNRLNGRDYFFKGMLNQQNKLDTGNLVEPNSMFDLYNNKDTLGCIAFCELLRKGYSVDDIMDPEKLLNERLEIGQKVVAKYANAVIEEKNKALGNGLADDANTGLAGFEKKLAEDLYLGQKLLLNYVDQKFNAMEDISMSTFLERDNSNLLAVGKMLSVMSNEFSRKSIQEKANAARNAAQNIDLSMKAFGVSAVLENTVGALETTVKLFDNQHHKKSQMAREIYTRVIYGNAVSKELKKALGDGPDELFSSLAKAGSPFMERINISNQIIDDKAKNFERLIESPKDREILGDNILSGDFQKKTKAPELRVIEVGQALGM